MRFSLIDRITELLPDARITATKSLSLAEEYLLDHFPRFPVMPGVLMLEALFQASAWLVRRSDDFAHAAVVLQQANSVKYSGFVQPGQTLVLAAEIVKRDQQLTTLKARGTSGDTQVVSAKLILRQFNLADDNPGRACDDQYARAQLQQLFTTLYRPDPSFQPAPC